MVWNSTKTTLAAVMGLTLWLGFPLGARAVTEWKTFVNPAFAGMTSGADLLVGTADDVPPPAGTTGFNSTGSLAHLFFFNTTSMELVAGASFTNDVTDNTSLPLGTGGTITDFSLDGRSEDNVFVNMLQLGFPYSIADDPSVQPHEMIVAAGGRSFTLTATQESCLDTDSACLNPLSVIDISTLGLILLRGDDPTQAWQNSPALFQQFFGVWTSGPFDVPAYLTFLSNEAPSDWEAISLTIFAQLMDSTPGTGNVSGIQAPLVNGSWLVGVIPSYTLPEPSGTATALAVLGTLAGLRRRSPRAGASA